MQLVTHKDLFAVPSSRVGRSESFLPSRSLAGNCSVLNGTRPLRQRRTDTRKPTRRDQVLSPRDMTGSTAESPKIHLRPAQSARIRLVRGWPSCAMTFRRELGGRVPPRRDFQLAFYSRSESGYHFVRPRGFYAGLANGSPGSLVV